ncbi:PIR Superfamily Protein [Plasmodium ovale curtisi]|uniref:PIR Superfamily Protein n=1 Tax=Plasmodium ovale curtisi TaxID=864141 RepID=A0A1A8X8F5_PLAOA|nr:PIR Superfamily Protein [Plasmodium ovale curtisi]
MPKQAKTIDYLRLFASSSKELISEKFYDVMDNDSLDLSKYNETCNEITVSDPKDRVIIICKKFLNFLENSVVLYDENAEYDVSILLNYWIYDKLIAIYGAKNIEKIRFAFSALQFAWDYYKYTPKNISYHNKCKPNFDVVNHQDWEKRKELYDYYVDYKTLHGTASTISSKCEEYYRIIKKKISLYEYFNKHCSPIKKSCPEFFEKCEPYNPESFIYSLPCHNKITQEFASPEAAKRDHASQEPARQVLQSETSYDTASTPETSEIGTKVGHSVLGVAPVLLTSTALYRYTPIGSWIRGIGGNRTNSISYMNGGEMEGFLPNPQESGDMLFGDTGNYISYQPM